MQEENNEPEEFKDHDEIRPMSDPGIIRFLTICFVLSMYVVIFLKILFIR